MSTLDSAWRDLGEDAAALDLVTSCATEVPLGGALPVGPLVHDAIAVASLSGALVFAHQRGIPTPRVALDPARIATAVTSERHFRWHGEPVNAWAELSGFWQTSDGWVRTHANYPHHRERLLGALGLAHDATGDELRRELSIRTAAEVDATVTARGGIATVVRTEEQWREHPHAGVIGAQPLVGLERIGDAPPTPVPERFRVLDLSRVIAGPVATRTLGLWGADVLRVDPPGIPEIEWQHLDSGAGKRSTILDATSPEFEHLLRTTDVLVLGYRPGALDAAGLTPELLAERYPGIIVARLSAWGQTGPLAARRGFDSIVQAATGIAWRESRDGQTPGALPAQALDHTAGYLLAAAVTTALRRRAEHGGSWLAEVSLARVAHELLHLPANPSQRSGGTIADWTPTVVTHGDVVVAAPAAQYEGSPTDWRTPPVAWGTSAPEWCPR